METKLSIIIPLLLGYALDLLLGDPNNWPHPVKGFGKFISLSEKKLNSGKHLIFKGGILTFALVVSVFGLFWIISNRLSFTPSYVQWIISGILVYYGLANQCLITEGRAVFKALDVSLDEGRKRLSWIVGRDTANLTENQVRTAVFETMSENLSDGVIAPLFYYAVGGLHAMFAYKMINTLDSMIGYKNQRYLYFGRIAANLDDVANFIPSRLTALLIALVSFSRRSLRFVFRYGNKHSSPNSGYPEAALAGVLNCRFGGPNFYGGILLNKPYIGENPTPIQHKELERVIFINQAVTFVSVALICLLIML